MNSSGVFRRIDELGRIVIPIEIRKILNIKEGENLEFYIINGELCLKKKSISINIKNFLEKIFFSMQDIIDGKIIISDREKVILSSDRSLSNEKLPADISALLTKYDDVTKISNFNFVGSNTDIYIYPYFLDNDISGFIIIYEIDDIKRYHKLIKFIINYVSNEFKI